MPYELISGAIRSGCTGLHREEPTVFAERCRLQLEQPDLADGEAGARAIAGIGQHVNAGPCSDRVIVISALVVAQQPTALAETHSLVYWRSIR